MPIPLPNFTDLKCAIAASGASNLCGALACASVAALIAHLSPPVAAAITIAKLSAAGTGLALPLGTAAAHKECQEQNNEAYRRDVAHQKEIGYCKSLEEGKVVVATLPGGRPLTMLEAAYFNQLPAQYIIDHEDCVRKGYIVPAP